jgi:hypothetical protein
MCVCVCACVSVACVVRHMSAQAPVGGAGRIRGSHLLPSVGAAASTGGRGRSQQELHVRGLQLCYHNTLKLRHQHIHVLRSPRVNHSTRRGGGQGTGSEGWEDSSHTKATMCCPGPKAQPCAQQRDLYSVGRQQHSAHSAAYSIHQAGNIICVQTAPVLTRAPPTHLH